MRGLYINAENAYRTVAVSAVGILAAIVVRAPFVEDGRSSAESIPAPEKRAVVVADPTMEASALCLSLSVMRVELGPEGASSVSVTGDGDNYFGSVYATVPALERAAGLVDSVLDPENDGVIASKNPAVVDALAASRLTKQTISAVSAEQASPSGLPEAAVEAWPTSDIRQEATDALAQARTATDEALQSAGCDPALFQAEPDHFGY